MFDNIIRDASSRYAMAQLCDALLPARAFADIAAQVRDIVENLSKIPFSDCELEFTLAGGRVVLGSEQALVSPADGDGWASHHFYRSVFVDTRNFSTSTLDETVWWDDELTPDAPEVLYHWDVVIYGIVAQLTGCSLATLAIAYAAELGLPGNSGFDPERGLSRISWQLARNAIAFRDAELSDGARSARMQGATRD